MTTFQIDWSKVDTSYWRDHPNMVKADWLWPGYHCNKDKELQADFGITCGDYYAMWDRQGGKCRIESCRRTQEKALAVDHDHITKVIYGLLCTKCNRENSQEIKEHIKHPLGEELGIKIDPRRVAKRDKRLAAMRKRTKAARARQTTPQPPAPVNQSSSAEEKYRRALESSR